MSTTAAEREVKSKKNIEEVKNKLETATERLTQQQFKYLTSESNRLVRNLKKAVTALDNVKPSKRKATEGEDQPTVKEQKDDHRKNIKSIEAQIKEVQDLMLSAFKFKPTKKRKNTSYPNGFERQFVVSDQMREFSKLSLKDSGLFEKLDDTPDLDLLLEVGLAHRNMLNDLFHIYRHNHPELIRNATQNKGKKESEYVKSYHGLNNDLRKIFKKPVTFTVGGKVISRSKTSTIELATSLQSKNGSSGFDPDNFMTVAWSKMIGVSTMLPKDVNVNDHKTSIEGVSVDLKGALTMNKETTELYRSRKDDDKYSKLNLPEIAADVVCGNHNDNDILKLIKDDPGLYVHSSLSTLYDHIRKSREAIKNKKKEKEDEERRVRQAERQAERDRKNAERQSNKMVRKSPRRKPSPKRSNGTTKRRSLGRT